MRTKTSSSISARRGAARLSAVWFIVAFVLLVIMGAYGFIAQDEAAKAEKAAEAATVAADQATAARAEAVMAVAERSRVLGFTSDAATIPSNVESAETSLGELKQALPDMESVKTFEDAVPLVVSAYTNLQSRLSTQAQRIKELEGQVSAERQAKADLQSEKDGEISRLRTELSDLRDTTSSEIARLEAANEDLASQVRAKTDENTTLADARRDAERVVEATGRNLATEKIRFERTLNDIAKRSEKADGEIAGVSAKFGIGFINLTASDRLSEGTVFRIVSGRPGADVNKAKGYAEVTNVGPTLSEVRIFDVVDPLGQPIVPGDKIFNPLYEPKGARNAVLAGSVEGIYNLPELVQLLGEIGITVQDELSNTTDYLITGGPIFVDEEGEPLEEPLKVEELGVYTEAKDRGVMIIPMRDVMQYFRR